MIRSFKIGAGIGLVLPPIVAVVWTYLSDHPVEWLRIKPIRFD